MVKRIRRGLKGWAAQLRWIRWKLWQRSAVPAKPVSTKCRRVAANRKDTYMRFGSGGGGGKGWLYRKSVGSLMAARPVAVKKRSVHIGKQ